MKKLYLFRHAKASQPPGGPGDFHRPLAGRGSSDAAAAGAALAAAGIEPGMVLCSAAARATETLEQAAPAFTHPLPTAMHRSLYDDDAGGILDKVRALDANIDSAMVVGHNPALGDLALRLAGSGEGALVDALRNKFPTAAICGLEFNTSDWNGVMPGSGRLVLYLTPKESRGQLAATDSTNS
jgi:phosphohistidine phosphatase